MTPYPHTASDPALAGLGVTCLIHHHPASRDVTTERPFGAANYKSSTVLTIGKIHCAEK